MSHSRWWRVLGRHVAGLAVALGAFGPAQADYVVGNWDPVFGTPFTGLSWRGSVVVDVPASCLGLSPGVYQVPADCAGPLTTVNATVEFFDTNLPSVVVETLDFTSTVSVNLLNVNAQGVIDGLGSTDPNPGQVVVAPGTGLTTFGVPAGTGWGLKFDDFGGQTVASLYYINSSAGPCPNPDLFCFEGRNNPDLPAQVTVTQVPEPASVVLALLGLGVIGLRRRQRA